MGRDRGTGETTETTNELGQDERYFWHRLFAFFLVYLLALVRCLTTGRIRKGKGKRAGKEEKKRSKADRKGKLVVTNDEVLRVEKVRADGGATRAHSGERRKRAATTNKHKEALTTNGYSYRNGKVCRHAGL